MNRPPRMLIMAGGTGGHVFPALAVADRLRAEGAEVTWLGTRRGLEAEVVPGARLPIDYISIAGLRGKGAAGWLVAPVRVARAVMQSLRVLRRRRPDAVLGMGGFVTGPGGVAARMLGLPLLIHEQNAAAGLTNRLLARIARCVMEAFPGTFDARYKPLPTGNPVRAGIAAMAVPAERYSGREGPMRLLVIGGSQGAAALNETLPEALALLRQEVRPVVRHQAGKRNLERARAAYAASGVEAEITPFIDDMAEAYGWADLVVCRSGALTVSEIAAAGLPSVLVPFPHAVDDHQTRNAGYLANAGAAVLLPQSECTPQRLAEVLRGLADRGRAGLLVMAEAARGLARTDATELVAGQCLRFAAKGEKA